MKPEDIKKYFKSGYKFKKATKMSDSSLVNWLRWGYVPYTSQKKIEKLTNGDLTAVWSDSEPKKLEAIKDE